MSTITSAKIIASVNRALWGEVPATLRSVQFKATGRRLGLRFVFDRVPTSGERDTMSCITAEIAADFPNLAIAEDVVAEATKGRLSHAVVPAGWQVAYARKESAGRPSTTTTARPWTRPGPGLSRWAPCPSTRPRLRR